MVIMKEREPTLEDQSQSRREVVGIVKAQGPQAYTALSNALEPFLNNPEIRKKLENPNSPLGKLAMR